MNKLVAELRRLYLLPEPLSHSPEADNTTVALNLVERSGMVRTMVVDFGRAADWEHVATLYQRVQDDLELPAPAVSVSGSEGYQLWFSLAEPVSAEQVRFFVGALSRTYLQEIAPEHLKFWPDADAALLEASRLDLPPALHGTSGKWSAFIDPGLGSMFISDPGLGVAPNMDRQADLLTKLESIKASEFQRALNALQERTEAAIQADQPASKSREEVCPMGAHSAQAPSQLNIGRNFSDPKIFLLAVMNDSSVSVDHRIEAAKALLPYFEKDTHQGA